MDLRLTKFTLLVKCKNKDYRNDFVFNTLDQSLEQNYCFALEALFRQLVRHGLVPVEDGVNRTLCR
jgi:hypothetical protein